MVEQDEKESPIGPLDAALRRLHRTLGWLDARRSYRPGIAALRQILPGDSRFGDSLSTSGTDLTHVVARRVWVRGKRRWSAAREIGLAVLQVADWLSPGPSGAPAPVAIVFTDLVGFSSWALRVGDEKSLDLLRSVDAAVTAAVDERGGAVVKRLGDGTMAVFDDSAVAAEACEAAIETMSRLEGNGYPPRLRAGLHFGRPHAIGGDYIGVDVNIASRLCEAAAAGQVLVSGAAYESLDGVHLRAEPDRGPLRGAPPDLEIYAFKRRSSESVPRTERGQGERVTRPARAANPQPRS